MKTSVCGYYGYNNYGDSLMLKEIVNFIPDLGASEIEVFSSKDSSESIHYRSLQGYDGCTDPPDLVLVGGGGIVKSDFWFFRDNLAGSLFSDIKLGLFNVNLTAESEGVLRTHAKYFDFAVVRDYCSWEIARNALNFYDHHCPVILAPDISFLKDKVVKKEGSQEYISICLNSYVLNEYFSGSPSSKAYANKFLIELTEFIKWLRSFGHKIQLVPSQIGKEINDVSVSGILDVMIAGADKVLYSNEDIENHLINSSLIISMRYHATLFAVKHGIPFIDITHHSKNKNFLIDNRLEDLSVDYWKSSLEDFKIVAEKAKYTDEIKRASHYLSVSSKEAWNKVQEALTPILNAR